MAHFAFKWGNDTQTEKLNRPKSGFQWGGGLYTSGGGGKRRRVGGGGIWLGKGKTIISFPRLCVQHAQNSKTLQKQIILE